MSYHLFKGKILPLICAAYSCAAKKLLYASWTNAFDPSAWVSRRDELRMIS